MPYVESPKVKVELVTKLTNRYGESETEVLINGTEIVRARDLSDDAIEVVVLVAESLGAVTTITDPWSED